MGDNFADELKMELHRLGADSISIIQNDRRKHPKIKATYGGDRVFLMTIPRGTVKDRAHIRANYLSKTRRAVRNLLGQ